MKLRPHAHQDAIELSFLNLGRVLLLLQNIPVKLGEMKLRFFKETHLFDWEALRLSSIWKRYRASASPISSQTPARQCCRQRLFAYFSSRTDFGTMKELF